MSAPAAASDESGAAGKIKAIDKASVHRICSGQVIVDLRTAVKELVENALDADATKVEVNVTDHGLGAIEVADNGGGISKENYASVALKHFTSKLSDFSDLESVVSYGFRGEALSSLCALSSAVEVTTKTDQDPIGARLEYDRNGRLVKQTPCARATGTTVKIVGLFRPQPVRFKQFKKYAKNHFADLVSLLQAYAVVAADVRIIGNHRSAKGNRKQFLSTQATSDMHKRIAAVFGTKFLRTLEAVHIDFVVDVAGGTAQVRSDADKADSSSGASSDKSGDRAPKAASAGSGQAECQIVGYVSKIGQGIARGNNSRQFIYVNARPVDLPEFTKALNACWRQYEMKHKSACVLDIRLPHGSYDVNVTPDKRKTFVVFIKAVVEALTTGLREIWEPSRGSFVVNQSISSMISQQIERSQAASASQVAPASADGGSEATDSGADSAEVDTEQRVTGSSADADHTSTASPASTLGESGVPESTNKRVVDLWNEDGDGDDVDIEASIAAAQEHVSDTDEETREEGSPVAAVTTRGRWREFADDAVSSSAKDRHSNVQGENEPRSSLMGMLGTARQATRKSSTRQDTTRPRAVAANMADTASSHTTTEETDSQSDQLERVLSSSRRRPKRVSPIKFKGIATWSNFSTNDGSQNAGPRRNSTDSSSGRSNTRSSRAPRSEVSVVADEPAGLSHSPPKRPLTTTSSRNTKIARREQSVDGGDMPESQSPSSNASEQCGEEASESVVENSSCEEEEVDVIDIDEDVSVQPLSASQEAEFVEEDCNLRISYAPESIATKLKQRLRCERLRLKVRDLCIPHRRLHPPVGLAA